MRAFARRLERFVSSEDGPTAVEYAVMLAVILLAVFSIVTTLGHNVSKNFNSAMGAFGS